MTLRVFQQPPGGDSQFDFSQRLTRVLNLMQRGRVRRLFSFPVALSFIVALWVFLGAGHGVWDPDIWWHLRNAEYLFQNRSLPWSDMYSFTVAGYPWLNHEWLAEIPYYLAWRALGLTGIYVLFIALLELILLGNFYWAFKTSGNVKGSFLVACYSVMLAAVSFGPRMILFGYAYLLVLLLTLWRFRTTGKGPLWLLPLLFCLWINTHGSWLLGLIVFGLFAASGLVEGSWGGVEARRWSPAQLRRLLVAGGASVAALFVNPAGHRLVTYPFEFALLQKLNVATIDEWASVDFHDARGKIVLLLLGILFAGVILRRGRWKLEELVMAAFGLYLGLSHIRFLFLAAILTAPFLARILDFLPPYRPEIDKPALNGVIVAGIIFAIVMRFPSEAELERGVENRFPAAALAFVESHRLQGRIFNEYLWGGYMVWRSPEVKTFVDGRTDIFDYSGVLQDYLDAMSLEKSLPILDRYQVRYVMVKPQAPLAYMLRHHAQWKVVYEDAVTVVLERTSPERTGPLASSSAQGP